MNRPRRTLLAAGAALPFLRMPARAATPPGQLVFGLSSFPPTMAPWANAGTAASTAKLMFNRGLLGYAPFASSACTTRWRSEAVNGFWMKPASPVPKRLSASSSV